MVWKTWGWLQGIRPVLLHLLAVTIHFPYRLLRSLNTLVFSNVFGRLAKEHLSKRLEQTFGASWRTCREGYHCTWIMRHAQKKVCHHCSKIVFLTWNEFLRKRPLLRKGTANSEFSHSQNLIYSDFIKFINALVFQIPPEVWCFRYDFWGPKYLFTRCFEA